MLMRKPARSKGDVINLGCYAFLSAASPRVHAAVAALPAGCRRSDMQLRLADVRASAKYQAENGRPVRAPVSGC